MNLPSVPQMQELYKEFTRIKKLNAPVLKRRAEIRASNERLLKQGLTALLSPVPPIPHRMSQEHEAMQEAEMQHLKMLKARKAKEWASILKQLPMPVRGEVAWLVFYDFLGDTPVKERSSALDNYFTAEFYAEMQKHKPSSTEVTEEALRRIGYSNWHAYRRARGNMETAGPDLQRYGKEKQ